MDELLELLKIARDDFTMETSFTIPWETEDGLAKEEGGTASIANEKPRRVLQLYASARENFDAKALDLLAQITSTPFVEEPSSSQPIPDETIVRHVPSSAERYPVEVFRDGAGTVVARSFVHAGAISGLQADAYRALRRLAEGIQRTSDFRSVVSLETVETLLFEWVRERLIGSTTASATDYLTDRAAADITTWRTIFPLFKVKVPEPIHIGQVTIRTLRSEDFRDWEKIAIGENTSTTHVQGVRAVFARERINAQGFAAAEITLWGEQTRVLEIASAKAEQAVSLLRLFTPAMIAPQGRSFCALFGRQQASSTSSIALSVEESDSKLSVNQVNDNNTNIVWEIEPYQLQLIREHSLDALAKNLLDDSASEFAEEVRAALYLYSQSALKAVPAEKLLTIMIPLESLLLRSSAEPIGENISYRLAHSIGQTPEERKQVLDTTRKVYSLRSAYVHHLKPVEGDKDLDTLRVFMEYAWRFFMTIGTTVNSYADKTAFLAMLDDRKL